MTTPPLRPGLLLAALLVAAPRLAAAPQSPRERPLVGRPSAAYMEIVERYAKGEHAQAVSMLEAWSEDDLKRELEAMREWERAARVGNTAGERAAFLRLPLRAIVMLHTDAADPLPTPTGETWPRCGRSPYDPVAEYAAGLLLLQPETDDHPTISFVRRWYRAVAQRSLRALCLADARRWAEAGLRAFPRDPELLTLLGTAEEAFGAQPVEAFPAATGRQKQQGLSARSERREHLVRARRSLEEALAAEAGHVEARVRLGRVQWRLGEAEAARASLRAALAGSEDTSFQYLAHLFLGRVEEDAGRLEEAERECRAALAAQPRSQAGAVALANVLSLGGDAAGARQALAAAVGQAPRPDYEDPYWVYFMGPWERATATLDALREESRE